MRFRSGHHSCLTLHVSLDGSRHVTAKAQMEIVFFPFSCQIPTATQLFQEDGEFRISCNRAPYSLRYEISWSRHWIISQIPAPILLLFAFNMARWHTVWRPSTMWVVGKDSFYSLMVCKISFHPCHIFCLMLHLFGCDMGSSLHHEVYRLYSCGSQAQ